MKRILLLAALAASMVVARAEGRMAYSPLLTPEEVEGMITLDQLGLRPLDEGQFPVRTLEARFLIDIGGGFSNAPRAEIIPLVVEVPFHTYTEVVSGGRSSLRLTPSEMQVFPVAGESVTETLDYGDEFFSVTVGLGEPCSFEPCVGSNFAIEAVYVNVLGEEFRSPTILYASRFVDARFDRGPEVEPATIEGVSRVRSRVRSTRRPWRAYRLEGVDGPWETPYYLEQRIVRGIDHNLWPVDIRLAEIGWQPVDELIVGSPRRRAVRRTRGFARAAAVPEPATWALLVLCLGAVFAWRRQR